jgi:glyoxylase-like metal-dependent hydrolase (beta-lactamase superfamily II)
MGYGQIITQGDIRYYEVAPQVFAAISLNNGLSWADAGFITAGKGLVYDTFFDLPHARNLKSTFVDLKGTEPTYVVNSHYNADHTWGNQVFSSSTIIMHKNAIKERFAEDPVAFDAIIKRGRDGTGSPGEVWMAGEFEGFDLKGIEWQAPDILLEHDTTILLGDMEVQILSVAPAHSGSDLLLWLPKEKVVFCGDIVFEGGGAISYSAEGMRLWIKALDYIIDELKPEVVVPGHGGLCDVEEVRLNKEYFEFVLDQVDRLYTDDITALELSKRIDIEKYKLFLQPERIFINVNALLNERRGIPHSAEWDTDTKALLKTDQDARYGIRPWNPASSWKE